MGSMRLARGLARYNARWLALIGIVIKVFFFFEVFFLVKSFGETSVYKEINMNTITKQILTRPLFLFSNKMISFPYLIRTRDLSLIHFRVSIGYTFWI
jgi:hypothetical protein